MIRIFLCLLTLSSLNLLGITPSMYSFTTKEYNGHQSNYDAVFDNNGNLFISNAYGLLSYDGYNWLKTALPGGKSPISLSYSSDSLLYVGADNEFGYFVKNKFGILEYKSLLNLLTTNQRMGIGWVSNCIEHNGKVYFVSDDYMFIYNGTGISIARPEGKNKFSYIGKHKDILYLYEQGKGISYIDEEGMRLIPCDLKDFEIRGVEKYGANSYYLYCREGIFKMINGKTEQLNASSYLSGKVISDVIIKDDRKIISTEQDGVFILDKNFKLLYHFNENNSEISSNYIYSVSSNNIGDICLATNNGITLINFGSPVLNVGAYNQLSGGGYSALLYNNIMYMGTSQGLYYSANWENGDKKFNKIPGTKAFIYDISVHHGEVFCGDQSDVYKIEGNTVKKLSAESWRGAWCIKSTPNNKNILLVGTYTGIDVYRKVNNEWKFSNTLEGLNETGRTFEFESDGVLWVCSGLTGLFKIKMDSEYKGVTKIENFCNTLKTKPDYFIELIKDNGQIIISSYEGLYRVEKGKLIKEISPFKFERIRKIRDGLVYTVDKRRPSILKKLNTHYTIDSSHVLNNVNVELIGSSEMIYEFKKDQYLIGIPESFVIVDNSKKINYFGKVKIQQINDINTDSLISLDNIELPYSQNNVRFSYSFSALEKFYDIDWYVMLADEDGNGVWKKSENVHFKEFSNLHEGDYIFKVKAVCRYTTLGESSMHFTILPPWYRTTIAKIIYFLMLLTLIYFASVLWKIRLEKVRQKLLEEKQKELLIQEKEYKAELLKKDVQEKQTEISYLALNNSQKIEMLKHISSKLNTISSLVNDPQKLSVELKSLKFSLQDVQQDEEKKWDEFQIHFNSEHNDFVSKIKEMDPKIKESVLLMCTYTRMGKSNKEICDLLNLSINALDKRKSRLKEKFNIPEDVTFNDFIRQL